jgi:poly-D-alanine transfer protein DltD
MAQEVKTQAAKKAKKEQTAKVTVVVTNKKLQEEKEQEQLLNLVSDFERKAEIKRNTEKEYEKAKEQLEKFLDSKLNEFDNNSIRVSDEIYVERIKSGAKSLRDYSSDISIDKDLRKSLALTLPQEFQEIDIDIKKLDENSSNLVVQSFLKKNKLLIHQPEKFNIKRVSK